jgi:hypothetical protein
MPSCYHAQMSMIETKTIGMSGQISIGKQHAGKTVTVEEIESGIWMIKTALVIPESELHLHSEPFKSRLNEAIAWAETHPAQSSDLNALKAGVSSEAKRKRRS